MLLAGSRLGYYEIISLLGAGGMGEVYRAVDSRLGREVAIKVSSDSARSPEVLRRFEIEARTLAALSHPNILQVHDVGFDQGLFFVVTELLEGETLRVRLDRSTFKWENALQVAIPIAEGLAAAHSKGVIHSDLKPENIFLSSDGQVKILDFGLARLRPILSPNDATQLQTGSRGTAEVVLRGTIPYMSPEQARGGPMNPASDIFSFGCMFYEMITGKRPFLRDTPVDTISAILNEFPPKIVESGKQIPQELDRLIERCLEKNVEMRFQSASDLAFDLKTILKLSSSDMKAAAVPGGYLYRYRFLIVAVFVTILLGIFYSGNFRRLAPGESLPAEIKSLAVLPLRNLSNDPQQEYFVDAMTDQLIANLARIESLRVISTTSVMEYKGAHKPLSQIAKELNVDAVIEGSVLPDANRVRITVQLIHAPSDRHLWSESYERDLNNILALQNEVASDITEKIQVSLTNAEKRHLEKAQTIRPDAYEAYLRGVSLMKGRDIDGKDVRLAADMFERAVSLDHDFAVAYAELSRAYSTLHFLQEQNKENLLKAKKAVDRAFELQPGLPEAHVALGWYYYAGLQDYPKAIREFESAQRNLPGNAMLLESLGYTQRRLGDFDAAFKSLRKVQELSPRDSRIAWEIGNTCMNMRKYAEADHYYDEAISLRPNVIWHYTRKVENHILWKGDTKSARQVLERIPNKEDPDAPEGWFRVELLERNLKAALRYALAMQSAYNEAIIYRLMQKDTLARKAFDVLRIEHEMRIKNPDLFTPNDHARLGIAYAGLGRKQDAIREGQLAIKMAPVSKDALLGPEMLQYLVYIYVMVGESNEALNQIDYLLSIPCNFSVSLLRVHPLFDSLHGLPGYQKIMLKYNQGEGS